MIRPLMRTIITALVLMFALGGFASDRTYKIGTVSWVGWAPLHVAAQKDFFKQQGVDVEIVWYEPAALETAFQSGEVDFRFDFVATVMQMVMKGEEVKLILETDWSHGGDKILAKKGKGFKSYIGSKIGTYRDNPAMAYFLNVYLSKQKLSLSDFSLVEKNANELLEAFIKDEFDFMICFDPLTIDAVKRGNAKVVATSSQFPGIMPEGMMAKSSTLADIPQEDLVKIIKAWIRAVEWSRLKGNWQEYGTILNQKNFPDREAFNDSKLRALLASVRIHDEKALLARNKDNGGTMRYLTDLKKFLQDSGTLEKDFNVVDLFDNQAVIKALE